LKFKVTKILTIMFLWIWLTVRMTKRNIPKEDKRIPHRLYCCDDEE
jgi:hypothetical protein